RYMIHGECAQCERYNTSEAWCQSCDPFKTTQGWTSGNSEVDGCIKEFQLKATEYDNIIEWISFDRLSNLQKIGESKFQALWSDGIRKVKNNTQSRTLSCSVKLKKCGGLQVDALEFIRYDSKHKIYGITQDTTGQYMIVFDDFYSRRSRAHGKCSQCERYNTSTAWCQSCDTYKITQGWTSGNKYIDKCITEFQLKTTEYEDVIEWIPFNRLSEFRNIGETEFQALWLDGVRNIKNSTQSRTLSCLVELKKFDSLQVDTLEFIRNDSKHKVCGITRDITGQYMIVYDDFYSLRYMIYEERAQCKRYNTSKAWCQSCDPFKTTQGWTSGNNEIDYCIKEFQLKATEYENIIEWISFDRLSNLQKIGESKFQALWSDGIRNVKDNKQSQFIEKLKKHIKLKDNKHKVHGITQDTTTGQYMIAFDDFHYIRNKLYSKCAQCNRYNTSFSWCQPCDPFKITKGWTSGNKDIDGCIKEFQLNAIRHEDVIEWIPFNRLINLRKIRETRFIAIWLDGIRKVENNAKSRSSIVELKELDNHQTSALDFIRKFKNQNKKHKVYGITQGTSAQYMVVVSFNFTGEARYGACRWSEHYNTSRAWCQLCDPFIITQEWTSESTDIDNCIKEFQSIATEYDEVIEWIPFNRLSNIREIGKGRFGCIYSAIWLDGKRKILNNNNEFIQSRTEPYTVALKTLPGSPTSSADFLREFKSHMQCRLMGSSLEVYGLTKNTTTNQHMMVLQYANNGTPDFYVDFAKLCMNSDPQERPTAKYIFYQLEEWYNFMDEDNESEMELEFDEVEISNKFWESDEIVKQLPVTLQKHQDVTYTSQFIDTYDISQRFSKLVKSVNLSQRHDESVNISTTG
ncbi:18197_t:CDS:2, partial [Acaulospora morrowiae]